MTARIDHQAEAAHLARLHERFLPDVLADFPLEAHAHIAGVPCAHLLDPARYTADDAGKVGPPRPRPRREAS